MAGERRDRGRGAPEVQEQDAPVRGAHERPLPARGERARGELGVDPGHLRERRELVARDLPDDDAPVASAGERAGAVPRHRESEDAARVSARYLHEPRLRPVEEADEAVVAAGEEGVAPRDRRDRADRTLVVRVAEPVEERRGLERPDRRARAELRRDGPPRPVEDGNPLERARARADVGEGPEDPPRCHVPLEERAVASRGVGALLAGHERDPGDRAAVPLERGELRPLEEVPEADRAVAPTGEDAPPVGRGGAGEDGPLVALEAADLLLAREVPDPERSVRVGREDDPGVGRRREREDSLGADVDPARRRRIGDAEGLDGAVAPSQEDAVATEARDAQGPHGSQAPPAYVDTEAQVVEARLVVVADRGETRARDERESLDPVGARESGRRLARGELPAVHAPGPARRDRALVPRHGERADLGIVARPEDAARCHVEEPEDAGRARRDEVLPARDEGAAAHGALPPSGGRDGAAGPEIPDLDRPVLARGGPEQPVGREADRLDRPLVPPGGRAPGRDEPGAARRDHRRRRHGRRDLALRLLRG